MTVFLLTVGTMAGVMLIMAIGLFFKYPCLRGSCGGADVLDDNGESLSCAACPRRKSKSDLPA
jgi:hypothetical protein